jgi:hypothetical protein
MQTTYVFNFNYSGINCLETFFSSLPFNERSEKFNQNFWRLQTEQKVLFVQHADQHAIRIIWKIPFNVVRQNI